MNEMGGDGGEMGRWREMRRLDTICTLEMEIVEKEKAHKLSPWASSRKEAPLTKRHQRNATRLLYSKQIQMQTFFQKVQKLPHPVRTWDRAEVERPASRELNEAKLTLPKLTAS